MLAPVVAGQTGWQKRIDILGQLGKAIRGYRIAYVFDVSQTEGRPLPEFAQVSGDPGLWLRRLEQVTCNRKTRLHYVESQCGAKGISDRGTICILEGLKPADKFLTLVHELGHTALHDGQRRFDTNSTVCETEAEAVGFVVSRAIGVDCLSHSTDYIQLYRGDSDTLRESMHFIRKTAADLIEALYSVPAPGEDA